jgi:hypothetical protein
MNEPSPSPRIKNVSWGRIEIEGREGSFKDAKLYPGGSREWDWNETGTRHRPGIQPSDVEELLENGAAVVVLSQGIMGRLQVSPATLQLLEERGVPVHVHRTARAVEVYNELSDREAVGGLFHTTC